MPSHEPVEVTHYTDPSCPWGYSAEPFLRALEWRFGDGLRWRHVLVGLSDDPAGLVARGLTPARRTQGHVRFGRRFGMPVATAPRDRLMVSAPACRAVKAAERQGVDLATALLRAIRLSWFTSTLLLDTPEGIEAVARTVPGLDAAAVVAGMDEPDVVAAFEADRAETDTADDQGRAAVAQERTATRNGRQRFTVPSLVFRRGDRTLVAGGWQPLGAYDLCVANLAPGLPRRPAPRPAELLTAFPGGLTTEEVARTCADHDDDPDRAAVLDELVGLCAEGRATRTPLGDDALWRPAEAVT